MKFSRDRNAGASILRAYGRQAEISSAESDSLLRALTSVDNQADVAVSRTRRRIYNAMETMEAQRNGRRKQTGLILMISLLSVALLAPAIWCSVEVFRAGGHFADLQAQSYLLAVMLFPAIVAAGIAGYLRNHRREDQHQL